MDPSSRSSTPFSREGLPSTSKRKREKEDSPVPERTPPSAPEASKPKSPDSSLLEKMREGELQEDRIRRDLKEKIKSSSKAEKQEEEGEEERGPQLKKTRRTSPKASPREFKKKSGEEGQEDCIDKLTKCFKVPLPEIPKSPKELAKLAVAKARERLAIPKPLAEEEILAIHALLTDSFISGIVTIEAGFEVDLIKPHPLHVFQNLSSSIAAIKARGSSYKAVLQERERFITQEKFKPLSKFNSENRLRKKEVLKAFEQGAKAGEEHCIGFLKLVKEYEDGLASFPITTTQSHFQTKSANKTHVLFGRDQKPHWIMKPVSMNRPGIPQAEHGAYLCNVHHEFPIPFTCLVEIGGEVGSAQMLIPDKVSGDYLKPTQISQIDLQKLAIFDLLFVNTDRHQNNFAFQKETDGFSSSSSSSADNYSFGRDAKRSISQHRVLGIDHDKSGKLHEEFS